MGIVICRCGMWLKGIDPDAAGQGRCPECGRVVSARGVEVEQPEGSTWRSSKDRRRQRPWSRFRRGRPLSVVEILIYPLRDGPGLALLAVFPPLLAIMSIPVFDLVLFFQSGPRGSFNPLALLVLPIALPLIFSFAMTFGYALLYFGRVLAASAMGEYDHPRYPLWNSRTILEGLGRWMWAGLMGVGVGLLPMIFYVKVRGEIQPIDLFVLGVLFALGAGYAQMGLAAAILHDNLISANPITIAEAIYRIGWDYLWPFVTTALALTLGLSVWTFAMYHQPTLWQSALALWLFWVFALYEGMFIMRVLGWCYFRNGAALGWFKYQPSWGAWERPGKIYQNS